MCNGWVDFVMSHESKSTVQFASLQSDFCTSFFHQNGYEYTIDSMIFWDGSRFWEKSNAVLQLAKRLRSPYSMLSWFSFIPIKLRNAVYDLVARNRHSLFSKKTECRLPTEEERLRFLS
ncbi:MAG: DUF393 domain-containing protein [Bacteroidia bacterium]|nr:DUF393 domain-containing protein [Bacteroidia bacterium]